METTMWMILDTGVSLAANGIHIPISFHTGPYCISHGGPVGYELTFRSTWFFSLSYAMDDVSRIHGSFDDNCFFTFSLSLITLATDITGNIWIIQVITLMAWSNIDHLQIRLSIEMPWNTGISRPCLIGRAGSTLESVAFSGTAHC